MTHLTLTSHGPGKLLYFFCMDSIKLRVLSVSKDDSLNLLLLDGMGLKRRPDDSALLSSSSSPPPKKLV